LIVFLIITCHAGGREMTTAALSPRERENGCPPAANAGAQDGLGVLSANNGLAVMSGETLELTGNALSGSLSPGERARVRASVLPSATQTLSIQVSDQSREKWYLKKTLHIQRPKAAAQPLGFRQAEST